MSGAHALPETLPVGFRIRLADDARVVADRKNPGGIALIGGSPTRLVRLKPPAARLFEDEQGMPRGEQGTGPAAPGLTVLDTVSEMLARRLLDAGIAHPDLSAADAPVGGVTVVVPVRDNQPGVDRLIPTLVGAAVIVVDDGSVEPVEAPGATVIRHPEARGPATARNSGLAAAGTPFVAFLDSDTVPRPGWLATLLAHFADPTVALAAPRIAALESGARLPDVHTARPASRPSALSRYEEVRSSLDLGPRPAQVVPGTPVSYVPSAAIVVRAAAVRGTPGGFDPAMHVAEDVDLCWRLQEAGWRLRYDPSAVVEHQHRVEFGPWIRRKAFYGEGAAPLAQRHPGAVAPMILAPWSAVATAGVFSATPVGLGAAGAASAVAGRRIRRTLAGVDGADAEATRLLGKGLGTALQQAALGICRHYWPLAVLACVFSRRARRIVAATAAAEGVADWYVHDLRGGDGRGRRPRLDPVRYVVCKRLDDAAYGLGLWRGAWRARSVRALLPRSG